MKRWFRGIWIALLSGTAFLSACGLKPSPTYYGSPPVDDDMEIKGPEKRPNKVELKQRLEAIKTIHKQREGAEVYGPPEVMEEYNSETRQLIEEAAAIEQELKLMDNR